MVWQLPEYLGNPLILASFLATFLKLLSTCLRLGIAAAPIMEHFTCAMLQTCTKALCLFPVHGQHLDVGVRKQGLEILLCQRCLAIPTASTCWAAQRGLVPLSRLNFNDTQCNCVSFTGQMLLSMIEHSFLFFPRQ